MNLLSSGLRGQQWTRTRRPEGTLAEYWNQMAIGVTFKFQIMDNYEHIDDIRERALQFLEAAPDPTTCLHGDLHIGNIITDGKRTLWIDVGDFAYGAPEWDLGMMFFASNYMSQERAISIFHLPIEVLRQHWAVFFKAYYNTTDQEELQKKQQALLPYFAVKMLFILSKIHNGSGPLSDMMLSLIRRSLGI